MKRIAMIVVLLAAFAPGSAGAVTDTTVVAQGNVAWSGTWNGTTTRCTVPFLVEFVVRGGSWALHEVQGVTPGSTNACGTDTAYTQAYSGQVPTIAFCGGPGGFHQGSGSDTFAQSGSTYTITSTATCDGRTSTSKVTLTIGVASVAYSQSDSFYSNGPVTVTATGTLKRYV